MQTWLSQSCAAPGLAPGDIRVTATPWLEAMRVMWEVNEAYALGPCVGFNLRNVQVELITIRPLEKTTTLTTDCLLPLVFHPCLPLVTSVLFPRIRICPSDFLVGT